MSFLAIIYFSMTVAFGARGYHAAAINRERFITAEEKPKFAAYETLFLILGMICFKATFKELIAAILLFFAFRWLSDYALNLARGKTFHYHPPKPTNARQRQYRAKSDILLSRLDNIHHRLAARLIVLLLTGIISFLIFLI